MSGAQTPGHKETGQTFPPSTVSAAADGARELHAIPREKAGPDRNIPPLEPSCPAPPSKSPTSMAGIERGLKRTNKGGVYPKNSAKIAKQSPLQLYQQLLRDGSPDDAKTKMMQLL